MKKIKFERLGRAISRGLILFAITTVFGLGFIELTKMLGIEKIAPYILMVIFLIAIEYKVGDK